MRKYTLVILSCLIGIPNIVATAISLSRYEHWLIRIFDYPKLQMIFFMFVALILYLLATRASRKWDKIYVCLLSITIIFQVYKIYPYTSFSKFQVLPAERNDEINNFSMVHCNVLMTNRDSKKVLYEMKRYNPDLILAVETDKWWENALKPLEKDYPCIARCPLENTYGMLIYSKLPMENTDFSFLVQNDVPSLNTVVTLRSGVKVNCYFIHPRPPAPSEALSSEARDAELVIVATNAIKSELPVITAGDLNDVGWSHSSEVFQTISGLLDPRIGRGLFATFNAKNKFFRWPLDHIFFSREFRVVTIKMLDDTGSDHFPIYVKLSYEPGGADAHVKLIPDEDDLKEARRKLNNKKE